MLEVWRDGHRPYCLWGLPILRLWVNSVAQPLDNTRCNTQNCWRSVDAHFQTWAGAISWSLLRITAANMLIMGICHSTALELYKMQHPKSLTLCWHSVDVVLMLCWCSVDTLWTLCWCSVDALLTLCWHSVDALLTLNLRCSSIDTHNNVYTGSQ